MTVMLETAAWAQSMSDLLSSGVPLPSAAKISVGVCDELRGPANEIADGLLDDQPLQLLLAKQPSFAHLAPIADDLSRVQVFVEPDRTLLMPALALTAAGVAGAAWLVLRGRR